MSTNWQDAALSARHQPPAWAQSLLVAMGVPLTGAWAMVNGYHWRYSVDGIVFNLRKLMSDQPGFFGPWATLEYVCLDCGRTMSSTGIHDQAELGAALQAWPPICQCQNGA